MESLPTNKLGLLFETRFGFLVVRLTLAREILAIRCGFLVDDPFARVERLTGRFTLLF
jgi:hypothetical protein